MIDNRVSWRCSPRLKKMIIAYCYNMCMKMGELQNSLNRQLFDSMNEIQQNKLLKLYDSMTEEERKKPHKQ